MKLPEYSKVKHSGVEWLGDMPAHWNSKRLKYLASINDEALPETTDASHELAYVDIGSVDSRQGITTIEEMVFEDAPSRARRIVRDGDTIISTVRTYLRAIAPIVRPPANMIVSTGFAVVRPRKLDSRYLSFALRESGFVETVVARSVGVSYPAVNASEIGTIPVPVPDVSEQRAIADFLDRETEKLDALVGKKRALIEKLKEKRAALIDHAMSGGAQDVSGRDFGMPWKFDLLPGWQRKPLKYLALMKGRLGWQGLRSDEYTNEGPLLVSSEHFVDDRIDWGQCNHVSDERFRMAPEIILRKEDVLFMKDGAAMGKLAYVDELPTPACLNSHLLVIRPGLEHCLPRFVYYALKTQTFRTFLVRERTGTTFYGLSQEAMGNFELSYPSIEEQFQIVSLLDRETTKIDRMAGKVEQAIERLLEYRSALVTAAVTGKIDVRETALTK